ESPQLETPMFMRARPATLSVTCLALVLAIPSSARAAAAAAPAFDWPAFNASSNEAKVKAATALLDAREESFRDLGYDARVTCVNVDKATGARHFVQLQAFEFRRLDDTYWLHI